jgi:hypothetical protein
MAFSDWVSAPTSPVMHGSTGAMQEEAAIHGTWLRAKAPAPMSSQVHRETKVVTRWAELIRFLGDERVGGG